MGKIVIDFKNVDTVHILSLKLGVPQEILENKINEDNPGLVKDHPINSDYQSILGEYGVTEINSNTAFYKMAIPKKNRNRRNQNRIVWAICDKSYKELYKKLNYNLNNFIIDQQIGYPHVSAHGFMKGKNILENAQCHCKAPLILHADISNFFNSITTDHIFLMFLKYGFMENVSKFLSKILTIEGVLPLGLHTSPLISNLICLKLDDDFLNLSIKYGCNYTRYADDITISGVQLPSRKEVEFILSEHDFSLSSDKYKITKPGCKHFVTGLSVETEIPRIAKYKKRKLRQELYYIEKFGVKDHLEKVLDRKCDKQDIIEYVNRIDGTVSYISYFERAFGANFEEAWFDIRNKQSIYPMYQNRERGCVYLFSDETEIEYSGDKFLAVGISAIMEKDIDRLTVIFQNLLTKYIESPFESVNKDNLKKNGLHYSDASEDLRKDFIEIISKEHIYMYISYKKLQQGDLYEGIYLELLHNLIRDRVLSTEYKIGDIIIEKNESKVSIQNVITMLSHRTRCKIIPKFEDKRCILLSSIDFALGYFRNYVMAEPEQERKRLLFERIRGQYKVIKNLDQRKVFTRRRPFEGIM